MKSRLIRELLGNSAAIDENNKNYQFEPKFSLFLKYDFVLFDLKFSVNCI